MSPLQIATQTPCAKLQAKLPVVADLHVRQQDVPQPHLTDSKLLSALNQPSKCAWSFFWSVLLLSWASTDSWSREQHPTSPSTEPVKHLTTSPTFSLHVSRACRLEGAILHAGPLLEPRGRVWPQRSCFYGGSRWGCVAFTKETSHKACHWHRWW